MPKISQTRLQLASLQYTVAYFFYKNAAEKVWVNKRIGNISKFIYIHIILKCARKNYFFKYELSNGLDRTVLNLYKDILINHNRSTTNDILLAQVHHFAEHSL